MKSILFVGGTGFVGKNIIPLLEKRYRIIAPKRNELDLKDSNKVYDFVKNGQFDIIINAANPTPVKNPGKDSMQSLFADSLTIFMNFYRVRDFVDKIIYFGSGAEYNKQFDIKSAKETSVDEMVPNDPYGLSKYIMNSLAKSSDNIYNLRLFGCYGPYDHDSKFITHVIKCCLNEEKVTIRQNCYFDYLQVYDLAEVVSFFIEHDMNYHDYNIGTGKKCSLVEIAQKVCNEMCYKEPVIVLKEGWNKEYTADVMRLEAETRLVSGFRSIEEGIRIQIEHETSIFNN